MKSPRAPYVHEATLRLGRGVDGAAVGAAVTIELCGSTNHEGGCRWPHNNEIWPDQDPATFRTLFVAPPAEEREVRERIVAALRSSDEWSMTAEAARPLRADEEALAARLDRTPLASAD